MKTGKIPLLSFTPLLLVAAISLGVFTLVRSQGMDVEPNETCETAEEIGEITLPYSLQGLLDFTARPNPYPYPGVPLPEGQDVDFYRFTGVPGSEILADLEGMATNSGTLYDPMLGMFDSACNWLTGDNDSGAKTNSRLKLTVPADGVFILAVTSAEDWGFSGDGYWGGSYRLTLGTAPLIGSISGQLVDAATGEPLSGDGDPYAIVELFQCEPGGENCYWWVNSQQPDSNGYFRFDRDFNGASLLAGEYQIYASAVDYLSLQTEPFSVGDGENKDLGQLLIEPYPVDFSDIRACEDLPPEGGICRYSLRITNRMPERLDGAAWSNVYAWYLGTVADTTVFTTALPQKLFLGTGSSKVVNFFFYVPATTADWSYYCTEVYVGQGRWNPFFNTKGYQVLFCITKGAEGFSMATGEKALNIFRQMETSRKPPAVPGQNR